MTETLGRKPLVIWGASGHARVVADAAQRSGRFEVMAFLDDLNPDRHGQLFCGKPVRGVELLPELEDGCAVIVGVGDCRARLRLAERIREQGFSLATVLHPQAAIAPDARIGEGSVVLASAVVNSGAVLEESVIVNSGAIVEHDCLVGAGAHLSPGAIIGGRVVIGRGTWLGLGARIRDGIRIGSWSVVGMGAVVVRDVPAGVLVVGVPAREIRRLVEDGVQELGR